jgi:mannose-1-phosphate guanylyltransferase
MKQNNEHIYGLIMAGGVGSRFWPESRESRPKQFLDILGTGKSLLRMSFERLTRILPPTNIRVLTHEKYSQLVLEHLPEISADQLILEPSRNNTAPCIAYASLKLNKQSPDSVLITTPADHIILGEDAFLEKIRTAIDFATHNDALITLGIQPTRPDTGYGYIQYEKTGQDGVHKVRRFTEKPELNTARSFVDSGDYLWNAGIFIWKARDVIDALNAHAADIMERLRPGLPVINTPDERTFIDREYPNTPSISIDFALMEKADNVYTIPADIGWSDLGTWTSVYEQRDKDEQDNVIDGHSLTPDTTRCLIRLPDGKLAVIKGLNDFIVVDDNDVLIIWPKSDEQNIKKIRDQIDPKYL